MDNSPPWDKFANIDRTVVEGIMLFIQSLKPGVIPEVCREVVLLPRKTFNSKMCLL